MDGQTDRTAFSNDTTAPDGVRQIDADQKYASFYFPLFDVVGDKLLSSRAAEGRLFHQFPACSYVYRNSALRLNEYITTSLRIFVFALNFALTRRLFNMK